MGQSMQVAQNSSLSVTIGGEATVVGYPTVRARLKIGATQERASSFQI